MCRFPGLPAGLVLILAATPGWANLVITPTFDGSITSDPNASSIEATINAAIGIFESIYSTPIDVPIYFQEGGGLGESNFIYYQVPYDLFYDHLAATDANPQAIAGLTANGGNSVDNPVTGTQDIEIKSANARALGIFIAPGCVPTGSAGSMQCGNALGTAYDGIITLNTSITYPPGSNNGSNYGLMSTVEHEIDEILGLGSSIGNVTAGSGTTASFLNNNPAPEDLFRYSAPGVFAGTVACPGTQNSAYFSYNGSQVLSYFNNLCNGADFGDWESNPYPAGFSAQVQDAFAYAGAQPLYGINEIAAESAIGYTLVAPEPGTWMLLSLALPGFVFARKCRRRS